MTSLSDALRHWQASGLPRLEAQMLLLHALGRAMHDRAWLLAHDAEPLADEAAAHLKDSATEAVDHVKGEGVDKAQELKAESQDAAQQVKGAAKHA